MITVLNKPATVYLPLVSGASVAVGTTFFGRMLGTGVPPPPDLVEKVERRLYLRYYDGLLDLETPSLTWSRETLGHLTFADYQVVDLRVMGYPRIG